MHEIAEQLCRWRADGRQVAVARVISVSGSAPMPPGSAMAVNDREEIVGSVSGGCVEGAVVQAALDVLGGGSPRVERFGYSDDAGFDVGLTCGGEIEVYVERFDW